MISKVTDVTLRFLPQSYHVYGKVIVSFEK